MRKIQEANTSLEAIKEWLVVQLSQAMEMAPDDVDLNTPFERFGVDSVTAVKISGRLETWLGRDLDPTLLFHYPTVNALAVHLSTSQS
jgi:acyl carrier protein